MALDPELNELLDVERRIGALGERLRQLRREDAERKEAMGLRSWKVTMVRAAFSWLKEKLMTRELADGATGWSRTIEDMHPVEDAEAFVDGLDQKGDDRG